MPVVYVPRPDPDRATPRDVAALLARLATDHTPRLTWYGPGEARIELSGRVLVTWVAKTAHQLLDEADLEAGGLVRLDLGSDWRAPVFWLAASYLGARVDAGAARATEGADPDVEVLQEGTVPVSATALTVVVPLSALPGPSRDLPPGAVDHGEVSHFPDVLPAPGPAAPLPTAGPGGRCLRGPGTLPEDLASIWAAGGSVVLHAGLPEDRLARVVAQERVHQG